MSSGCQVNVATDLSTMDNDESFEYLQPLGQLTGIVVTLNTKQDVKTLSIKPEISNVKDLMDARLGVPIMNPDRMCSTCGGCDVMQCEGHLGCLPLPRVIYNPHSICDVVKVLNKICLLCGRAKKKGKSSNTSGTFNSMASDNSKVHSTTVHLDTTDDENMDTIDTNEKYRDSRREIVKRPFKSIACKKHNTLRLMPLRKSKKDVEYNENLQRNHGSAFSLGTSRQKVHIRNGKCLGTTNHNEFLFTSLNTSNLKCTNARISHDCLWCQDDFMNSIEFKFKLASKNIYGKIYPVIEVKISRKGKRRIEASIIQDCVKRLTGFKPTLNMEKRSFILLPFQARDILRRVQDKRILTDPDSFFLECIAVTPNMNRLNERHHFLSNGPQLTPDDKTKALENVLKKIDFIKQFEGSTTLVAAHSSVSLLGGVVSEYFQCSKVADSKPSLDKVTKDVNTGLAWMKKTFLGKRSDFSIRAVTVGDPNLALDEILVPTDIAEKLLIRETVSYINWGSMQEYIDQSFSKHHRQMYVRRNDDLKPVLKGSKLEIGDVVYRAIKDGDMIIINRTPSIHRHSLIAFRIKLLPVASSIAINPLVCLPFGADFDGDCLHGFVPQSQQSKAEALEFMSLEKQLINSQGEQALITVSHDSLLAAYALTSNDTFISKPQMQQFQMFFLSEVPPLPAILKAPKLSGALWTGKQLLSMGFPKDLDYEFCSNPRSFNRRGKQMFSMTLPKGSNYSCSRVLVSKGEILHCCGTTEWFSNSNTGIFQKILSIHPHDALHCLGCCQALLNEWISFTGFSVGVQDVYATSSRLQRSKMIDEVCLGMSEAKRVMFTTQAMYDPYVYLPTQGYDTCQGDAFHNTMLNPSKCPMLHEDTVREFKHVFLDIINTVVEHADKDNSMLAMVRAGSKGTLQKFVQQTACIGWQLYKEQQAFPFGVPSRFLSSFICSLRGKLNDNSFEQFNGLASCQILYTYGLLDGSFFEGLRPLDYFLHSTSIRGNSFGQGADVPGQLFRKLMFFLRDIYLAYDGTVRNLYGNQIVQFSYGNIGMHYSSLDRAGEPVGSLAASSIGAMAYNILDKQCPIGQKHPSKILQEVFFTRSNQTNKHGNEKIILRLSESVKDITYGFEYGALKIKKHLENIWFSDLITSIEVVFDFQMCEETSKLKEVSLSSLSPWVIRCSLSWGILFEKSINIGTLIDTMDAEYRILKKKFIDLNLPDLHIIQNPAYGSACLDFVACFPSVSLGTEGKLSDVLNFPVIHYRLVSMLSNIRVKGNSRIKSVQLVWKDVMRTRKTRELTYENSELMHETSEVALVVEVSAGGKSNNAWKVVLGACETVAELIDWCHSAPESASLISSSMGVEAARTACFLELKHATKIANTVVHKKHLNLIVDSLSTSGTFFGLFPVGLKKSVNKGQESAPFMQGCFMNPRKNLLEAAQHKNIDKLCGTLDSLIWGNVPPVGTGVKIDILLKKEMHGGLEVNDIGEFFCAPKNIGVRESIANASLKYMSFHVTKDASRSESILNGNEQVPRLGHDHVNMDPPPGFETQSLPKYQARQNIRKPNSPRFVLSKSCMSFSKKRLSFRNQNSKIWNHILHELYGLRHILHKRYKMGDALSASDTTLVLHNLEFHPRYHEKIGVGIQEIKIGQNSEYPNSKCFVVLRKDGSLEDFSYHKCLRGKIAKMFHSSLVDEYDQRFCSKHHSK